MTPEKRRAYRLAMCADMTALMLLGRKARLRALVRQSLADRRLTRRFFEELMIHLSLVLGFPHMIQGLELVAEARPRGRTIRPGTTEPRVLRTRGLRMFRRVYGAETERVLSFLDSLKGGMSSWVLENVYGRVYARAGLSLAEREVSTIVALASHAHLKQLKGHLRGAHRCGLTERELGRLLSRVERRHGIPMATALSLLKAQRGGRRREGVSAPWRTRRAAN